MAPPFFADTGEYGMLRGLTALPLMALMLAAVTPGATAQNAAQSADVPPDPVILMRQHWLDGDINAFNFRHSAEMFETRKVARSGPVRALPKGPAMTPPTYQYDGKTRSYDELPAAPIPTPCW
jgi:hypothetical protein